MSDLGDHVSGPHPTAKQKGEPFSKPEPLSLKGTYADAILASKTNLDEAHGMLNDLAEVETEDLPRVLSNVLPLMHAQVALGEAYARLAVACQRVPG